MSDASRAAFEAWEDDFITRHMERPDAVDAWQASRKAALEAALKIIEDTREYTRFDAVQAIKELME